MILKSPLLLSHVGESDSNSVSLCGWGVPIIADNGELRIPVSMAHSGGDKYTSSFSRDLHADQNTLLEVHSILDTRSAVYISLDYFICIY